MLLRKVLFHCKSSFDPKTLLFQNVFRLATTNKNLYQVLGVLQSASQSEIKSAYYKLAKQYHPDVNKGNEERFKEISSAYETLSATDKRKQYDDNLKYGATSQSSSASGYSQQSQYKSYQNYYNQRTNENEQANAYRHYYNRRAQNQQRYYKQHQDPYQEYSRYYERRNKGPFHEQYSEYYYDPVNRRYKARRSSQYYEENPHYESDPYYQFNQRFKNQQEFDEFKRKAEEEYLKAQQNTRFDQSNNNYDEMMRRANEAILKGITKFAVSFFAFVFLLDTVSLLWRRKEYQVYDSRTNTLYLTEDKQQAELLQRRAQHQLYHDRKRHQENSFK